MPFDVVVVGAAGLDTCVYLPGPEALGDTTFTDNRDGVGQAGGYASLAYASLGYRTAYVGALGDDAPGAVVRQVLGDAGIDLSRCFDDPDGTARSVNLMAPDGSRRGCYDGRGNPRLHLDPEATASILSGARLCHCNIPNWAREVLPIARRAGVPIVSDLQDVADPFDAYRLDFVRGSDAIAFSCARGLDPAEMMRAYWSINPRLVQLAGLGAGGCAVGLAGDVQRHVAPDVALPILDTNGAGDTLCAGFTSALLLDRRSPSDAARRGQLGARITCSQRVPKHEFATQAAIERLLSVAG